MKRELRRICFNKLKTLTDLEKSEASSNICRQLENLGAFDRAKIVFAYLPLPSEPDLTSLFNGSKTWGFARVLSNDSMEFREVTDLSNTVQGKFKISEPDPEFCPVLSPESADLIIIPGVGFSVDSGNRLGRGKGHYDRYLEKVLSRENLPLLIGVCFAVQLCEIKAEAHDIPMDKVVYG